MERLMLLRRWLGQAQALQQVVLQATSVVDEGLAKIRLSTSLDDKRSVANLNADVTRARTTALHAEKLLLGMTHTESYSTAAVLLMDAAVRLDAAANAYLTWRVVLAKAGLLAAVAGAGATSDDLGTDEEQAMLLEVAQRLFETAVRRTLELMPAGAAEELTR